MPRNGPDESAPCSLLNATPGVDACSPSTGPACPSPPTSATSPCSATSTSSPADSPASPSPSPDGCSELTTLAISGLNLLGLWPPCGPVGACLRTILGSSTWRVDYPGYSLIWKRKATRWKRSLFQLRLLVPRTTASASGLLPTPTTDSATERKGRYAQGGLPLTVVVRLLPTPLPSDVLGGRTTKGKKRPNENGLRMQSLLPTAADANRESVTYMRGNLTLKGAALVATPRAEGFDAGAHRGNPDSLHSRIKQELLPTPTVHGNNNRAGASPKSGDGLATRVRMLPTATASDHKGSSQQGQRRGQLSEVVAGKKLNPRFVTWMMGFPDGWMSDLPEDPLAPLVPSGRRELRALIRAARNGEKS